jgi:hypothetical protein
MATKQAEYLRQWRERQKARGLCTQCTQPATPGKTRCEGHQRAVNEASARWHEGQRMKGLCLQCTAPVLAGFLYCEAHRNQIIIASRRAHEGGKKQARFTDDDVRDIKAQLRQNVPIARLAEKYHVPYHAIQTIKKAKKWAHI